MNIEIAKRLRPHSHVPGVRCLLPLSWWSVEVFPTLLRFQSLNDPEKQLQIVLTLAGPIEGFTAEVDLEKGAIRVFGMTQVGYVRYQIRQQSDGIALEFEKLPKGEIECLNVETETYHFITEKQSLVLGSPERSPSPAPTEERLSLGIHKAQDWELIRRRTDLKEIFPIWLRAGGLTPPPSVPPIPTGTLRQLSQCQEAIEKGESQRICPLFLLLFRTAFSGICVPRVQDEDFQGILPFEEIALTVSPLPLLTLGAALIRSLFFEEKASTWKFLPCLPSDFPAGRFVGIVARHGERIQFEWAKHRLRKVVIHTAEERDVVLQFPKSIRSLRLKTARTQKGKILSVSDGYAELHLKAHQVLFLDRFEK